MLTSPDQLGPLAAPLQECRRICMSFIEGLAFIVNDAGRDPAFSDTHLLSYVGQDYLQGAFALPLLANEGFQTDVRRELRFILETSIKVCFVEQQDPGSLVQTKLNAFKNSLDSSSISIKNRLVLQMMPEPERAVFQEELGRLYRATSEYVHLTVVQLLERVRLVDAGRTVGRESPDEVERVNQLVRRVLAAAVVLLLHSLPECVAGDLLVDSDGSSNRWLFMESRFVSAIDAYFDYKAERQLAIGEIREKRRARIK